MTNHKELAERIVEELEEKHDLLVYSHDKVVDTIQSILSEHQREAVGTMIEYERTWDDGTVEKRIEMLANDDKATRLQRAWLNAMASIKIIKERPLYLSAPLKKENDK